MYAREYQGRELQFEASGGLIHASLVIQDKQTNSYWALMQGESISGPLKGTALKELAVQHKMRWGEWVGLHPDTLVLSVTGVEHIEANSYEGYLDSDQGFGGTRATDRRLSTKTPVYAFRLRDKAYAVPSRKARGGATFRAGGEVVFLHRPAKAGVLRSTAAFVLSQGRYRKGTEGWYEEATGAVFDPVSGSFAGASASRRLSGFDTFWYNWSLNSPDTLVIKKKLR